MNCKISPIQTGKFGFGWMYPTGASTRMNPLIGVWLKARLIPPRMKQKLIEEPDAFDQLGFSAEKVDSYLKDPPQRPTNREICLCGHPMSKHEELTAGAKTCVTSNLWCPCSEPFAIVEVDDVRYFMRQSHGRGSKHALTIGLRNLQKAGKRSQLLINPHCFMCKDQERPIEIVGIDRNGGLAISSAPVNLLVCEACTYRIMGVPIEET